jgi:hypothetical protein
MTARMEFETIVHEQHFDVAMQGQSLLVPSYFGFTLIACLRARVTDR